MTEYNTDYEFSFYSNNDPRLTRVLAPDEVLCIEGQQSDNETMMAQSLPGTEDDVLNKMKGMTEEQVRELINKMNLDEDCSSQEEVEKEQEIKDSHVEEKTTAKNKKKKVANTLPKKVAKGQAKKNKPVHMEKSEDDTTLPTDGEMPSVEDIRSKKSKKGGTENIDTDNSASTSNNKPNRRIKVVKAKQNEDKNENDTENQSDLNLNKEEIENNGVDTNNIQENNEKGIKSSKKTKVNETIEGKKVPVSKQNSKENNETKGKPDKSLKKVIKEPITEVPQEKMPQTEEIINNSETPSTRSTRAKARNALNVIQEKNDSVEKQSDINIEEPAKGRKMKNLKKGGEQINENVAPVAHAVMDVELKSKKKHNTAKEKAPEKDNNPSTGPKNKQKKSKPEILLEKNENKEETVSEIVTKRATRKK